MGTHAKSRRKPCNTESYYLASKDLSKGLVQLLFGLVPDKL